MSILDLVQIKTEQTLASSCNTDAYWFFQAIAKPCSASLIGLVCRQMGPTGKTLVTDVTVLDMITLRP